MPLLANGSIDVIDPFPSCNDLDVVTLMQPAVRTHRQATNLISRPSAAGLLGILSLRLLGGLCFLGCLSFNDFSLSSTFSTHFSSVYEFSLGGLPSVFVRRIFPTEVFTSRRFSWLHLSWWRLVLLETGAGGDCRSDHPSGFYVFGGLRPWTAVRTTLRAFNVSVRLQLQCGGNATARFAARRAASALVAAV